MYWCVRGNAESKVRLTGLTTANAEGYKLPVFVNFRNQTIIPEIWCQPCYLEPPLSQTISRYPWEFEIAGFYCTCIAHSKTTWGAWCLMAESSFWMKKRNEPQYFGIRSGSWNDKDSPSCHLELAPWLYGSRFDPNLPQDQVCELESDTLCLSCPKFLLPVGTMFHFS